MKSKPTEKLIEAINQAIDSFDSDLPISTAGVADIAARSLDPEGLAPELVMWGCVLELRQLAREALRNLGRRSPEDEMEAAQGQLFEVLQPRYPVTRGGDIVSIPRQEMTFEEYMEHAKRLEREGQAKIRHSDALKAEALMLAEQGWFSDLA